MKAYNRPIMQVENCKVSYMLMQNVSGGSFQGVHEGGPVTDPIEIN
jgi:hypothetical protein